MSTPEAMAGSNADKHGSADALVGFHQKANEDVGDFNDDADEGVGAPRIGAPSVGAPSVGAFNDDADEGVGARVDIGRPVMSKTRHFLTL